MVGDVDVFDEGGVAVRADEGDAKVFYGGGERGCNGLEEGADGVHDD